MLDQIHSVYFPGTHPDWDRISPQQAGFDPEKLKAAIDKAHEIDSPWSRDLERPLDDMMHEPPPYNEKIGPLKARGAHSGLILRGGRIAAEWGTPDRVDMTFSATKSYLSLCLGLAWDRGLIPDFDAPVCELVDDGGFEPPHNDRITWRMLFQQTSEWTGELWGKPDWLDHNRFSDRKGEKREMEAPGTHWEYNDVRVNRASLALLRVWKRPLPEVLKEYVMGPIGASDTWEWHGYRNSFVTIDGREMQSVSGGGHWGGGMFINAFDHARIGQLLLMRGEWYGQRLLSEAYLDQALAPCPRNPNYGFMFWLNGPQEQAPSAPKTSFFLRGAGSHIVWIDPEHDLVTVLRWVDKERADEVHSRVLAALD